MGLLARTQQQQQPAQPQRVQQPLRGPQIRQTQVQPGTALPPPPPSDPLPDDPRSDDDRRQQFGAITEIVGGLDQLLSSTGALDAFFQNIDARNDPTIPALLNAQLQNFVGAQGGGGMDLDAFLGGSFASAAPANPITLGAGDGSPFDIPLQQAGGVNPIVDFLGSGVVAPAFLDSLTGIADLMFQLGGASGSQSRPDPDRNPDAFSGTMEDLLAQVDAIINAGTGGNGNGGNGGGSGIPTNPGPAPPLREGSRGSFQLGGTVPVDVLFDLHKGETIIPAINPMLQGQTAQPLRAQAFQAPPTLDPSGGPAVGTNPRQPIQAAPTLDPSGGPAVGTDPRLQNQTVPTPLPPATGGGGALPTNPQDAGPNPLQIAIEQLLGLSGQGPITPELMQQQQTRINDTFANQLQGVGRNVAQDFGARGLGGSGIQEQLRLQQGLGLVNNATDASNQLAFNGANQNFQSQLAATQGLGGLSLGAGQFGLQQNQQAFNQNQSMFESLIRAIQGSHANPGDNPVQNVNVI